MRMEREEKNCGSRVEVLVKRAKERENKKESRIVWRRERGEEKPVKSVPRAGELSAGSTIPQSGKGIVCKVVEKRLIR